MILIDFWAMCAWCNNFDTFNSLLSRKPMACTKICFVQMCVLFFSTHFFSKYFILRYVFIWLGLIVRPSEAINGANTNLNLIILDTNFSELIIQKDLTLRVCWRKVWNAGCLYPSLALRGCQICCTQKVSISWQR